MQNIHLNDARKRPKCTPPISTLLANDQNAHDQNNIPDILNRWNNLDTEAKRKRTEQSFLVPMAEIVANDYDLSLNRYKEIVYEAIAYDKPQTLVERIEATDKKRMELIGKLKNLLVNQEIFGA